MILEDEFRARGHRNIRALHPTTIEVTREETLTPRGDCIIAVSSEKGLRDLNRDLLERVRQGWYVALVIEVGGLRDWVVGLGDPRLGLGDPVRIVVRKSLFIDNKTLMVRADKAARDIDRRLVKRARDSSTEILLRVLVSDDIEELREYIVARY